jgi:hypothetical protein
MKNLIAACDQSGLLQCKDRKERTTQKTLPLNSNAPLPPNGRGERPPPTGTVERTRRSRTAARLQAETRGGGSLDRLVRILCRRKNHLLGKTGECGDDFPLYSVTSPFGVIATVLTVLPGCE